MNKRIKELAEQAGFSFKYKTAPDEMNPGHKLKDLKKFAELILKECTDVLMQRHEESKHSHNYYHVTANMLKNHFGVEE